MIFGSGAATGKVSYSTFTHLWCQQPKCRNHKKKSTRNKAHLLGLMKKSPKLFLGYNHTKFTPPNILQSFVFSETVEFLSSIHIARSSQRKLSETQISSLQVYFPDCHQSDFSHTYTHLFHKYVQLLLGAKHFSRYVK